MKTKSIRLIFPLLILGAFITIATSCGKDDEYANIVKDVDGNSYKTVTIGTQVWMAENLRTKKYNDGTAITTGLDNSQWVATTSAAYSIYPHASIDGLNSDAEVLAKYGAHYNWYAVNTGKLCPTGWHVPTIAEYQALSTAYGGNLISGGKMKSTTTAPSAHPFWAAPNAGATNESGFTAIAAGYRTTSFMNINTRGLYWSSTLENSQAQSLKFASEDGLFYFGFNYHYTGLAVRCIKD
jgi:uncharacterized protein (TIGR02145 family)